MTSGGDGFHVEPAQLTSHSSTVSSVASSVEDAGSAAGTERLGGLVYGVLLDALALPFLNMWGDSITKTISKNAEVGRTIAEKLASNAATYTEAETTNTTGLASSGGH